MNNKSYWDTVFEKRSDLIIMHLMKKLEIDQLDFKPTDIITDQQIFIGRMDSDSYRISILNADTKVIGGDLMD
jgi:hypothetical protein